MFHTKLFIHLSYIYNTLLPLAQILINYVTSSKNMCLPPTDSRGDDPRNHQRTTTTTALYSTWANKVK